MPKQCLFCDNVADTKEHLWSDWILQGLKRVHPIRQVIQKSEPREFYGDVRIKCACSTCNHGWMTDLENSVSYRRSDGSRHLRDSRCRNAKCDLPLDHQNG